MAETETQLQTPAAAKSATTTPTKQPLSVLVTGCSEGGIGCALAEEFQRRGLRVFATARNTAKIPEALRTASGVEVLTIDVTDKESVRAAAAAVSTSTGGTLNLLVNNAGGGYQVPLLDADLDVGRRLFETNIWGTLSVTQTFSPLLLAAANENGGSGTARIVNIGSVVGYTMVPWEDNASKGALAMLNDTMRIELQPLGIKVIHIVTGGIATKFFHQAAGQSVPEGSVYTPILEDIMNGVSGRDAIELQGTAVDVYARNVVSNVLSRNPSTTFWTGASSTTSWLGKRFGFDLAVDFMMMYLFKMLGLRKKFMEATGLTKKKN